MKPLLTILLNLCLGFFLADAFLSLADYTCIVFFGLHTFSMLQAMASSLSLLICILVYVLMGLTPMVPKRVFLPVTLFNPVAVLAAIPVAIFCYNRSIEAFWFVSFGQVLTGLLIVRYLQGRGSLQWPLVAERHLGSRQFSWINLVSFAAINLFVVLPVIVIYLAFSASLAVGHFTAGFLTLSPTGLAVHARTYTRGDGKTIQLIPMAHVADAAFYRAVSTSFPSNCIVLLEGVSDRNHLLTNGISYKRAARTLGLTEQVNEFAPTEGELVTADIDVAEFSKATIDFINLVMLLYANGPTPELLSRLMTSSAPPHFEQQLLGDLLHKRNQHLLQQIRSYLPESEHLVVPWGVAHMPEISEELERSGFRVTGSHEFQVIRFGRQHSGNAQ